MKAPSVSLPVTTPRLVIRTPVWEDRASRYALHSDPDYIQFIGEPIDREWSDRQFAAELEGDTDLFISVVEKDNSVIGECVLRSMTTGEVELVLGILPEHRGVGYSLEIALAMIDACFKTVGISSIIARVEESNGVSKRLVERLGMARLGRIPTLEGKEHWCYQITKSGQPK